MRATLWYCVQQPNCLRSLSFPKRTLQRKGFQKISVWLGRGQLAGSGAKILALQSSRRSPRVCGHVPFQDTQFVLSMANRCGHDSSKLATSGTRRHAVYRDLSAPERSEEHTSELQSRLHLVCRLLLEKQQ